MKRSYIIQLIMDRDQEDANPSFEVSSLLEATDFIEFAADHGYDLKISGGLISDEE